MNEWMIIIVLIAVFIIILGIFAAIKIKKQKELRKKYPGYPKGYWMDQGIGIGIAIGAGLGVALNNIAIGIGVGIAIGAAIGSGLEKKHKDEVRPLTEEEKKLRKQSIMFLTGILIIGSAVFITAYFLLK